MQNGKRNKSQQVYDFIFGEISSGRYRRGDQLPTDIELARQFKTSRPTIARALKSLQSGGVIERIPGSGTYVRRTEHLTGRSFGLLIPKLGETEIFEPICGQIAREAQQQNHTLLWGNMAEAHDHINATARAEQACRSYIDRGVAGIFLALELPADEDELSRHILDLLADTTIPLVLLDRDIVRYPERSPYDLVGIDNRRAGYQATDHLLKLGCRRVDFVTDRKQGPAIAMRIQGYRDALLYRDLPFDPQWIHAGNAADPSFAGSVVASGASALVCQNDPTAAAIMNSLDEAGVRIPADVRIVSIDDVKYASMLRVPLTTVHQPCRAIGMAAFQTMLERIENPDLPPRDVLMSTHLVVRKSCGAA
ncbi:MAG: GntR family transcriptional regulator [Verrucomicrobia bacterium]|nr:GntR family transcriptional regulator [Verrucomicrobiota bacterium]